jgi:RNA polymerase sigma-70 factor (ECF subfamily)
MDTDVSLAAHLARDLDTAFPILVSAHADRLYSIALRLLGDGRDAEEVAQDTLVRAYRAMAEYDSTRIAELRLRPWLASIAVNLARNRRRNLADRQPPRSLEPLLDAGFDPSDPGPAPDASAEASASLEDLAALLLELPPAMRAAVVLRHVDGLSVAETAAALGRPEGTVKAQVARGLERLRRRLAERAARAEPSGTGLADPGASAPRAAARRAAAPSTTLRPTSVATARPRAAFEVLS